MDIKTITKAVAYNLIRLQQIESEQERILSSSLEGIEKIIREIEKGK